MDLIFFKVNDETALTFSQWLSIIAIVISLIGTYLSNFFSDRVNNQMKVKIAESNKLAANANEHAEELKQDNLKLGLQLEKERQARLDIERRLAPRFLSDNERSIIAESIRPYAGHQIIVAGIGDPESELLAAQFVKLFEASSWQVEKISGALMGPAQYGLFLRTPKQPGKAAQALISGLNRAGIKFKLEIDSRFGPEAIELRVGDKDPTAT